MPQLEDHSYSTLSSGVTAAATSWPLVSGSSFPDPADGQYWVRIWNVTDYSDPKDDSETEECRVTNKVSNALTVVRGEDGETAYDHNTGGKTYAVALMAGKRNIGTSTGYHDVFNVIDYGADNTGTVDATSAIEDAIDAATATGTDGGAIVYIPDGSYKVTTVSIPTTGVTIQGSRYRKGSVLIQDSGAGAGAAVVDTDYSSGQQKGWSMKDLSIQGANKGHVVHVQDCKNGLIENCYFIGPGNGYACLRMNKNTVGTRSWTVNRLRYSNSNTTANAMAVWIGDSGDGTNPLTSNITIRELRSFNNSASERLTGPIIFLDHAAKVKIHDIKADGILSDKAFRVDAGFSNSFYNCGAESPSAGYPTVEWYFDGAAYVDCHNCTISDEPTTGMDITGTSHHILWEGGSIRSTVDIDETSRWCTFREFAYTSTFPITWTGTSPEIARETTTIKGSKVSSTDAPLAEFKENSTPLGYQFYIGALAQSTTDDVESADPANGGDWTTHILPFDGFFVGMAVELSSPRTAGSITVNLQRNGSNSTNIEVVIDSGSTTTRSWIWYNNENTHDFQEGHIVGIKYTTDASFQTTAGYASTKMRVTAYVIRGGEPLPTGSATTL